MSASLLGTTGNWGIPQDQPGLIIYEQSFEYSVQEKPVLTKGGEIQGLALYQPKVDVKLSTFVAKDAPFDGNLGAALTLANTIPDHLDQSGGTTITMGISRTLSNEDFEKLDIAAVHHPFLTLAGP